jgi:hypothetical protein
MRSLRRFCEKHKCSILSWCYGLGHNHLRLNESKEFILTSFNICVSVMSLIAPSKIFQSCNIGVSISVIFIEIVAFLLFLE